MIISALVPSIRVSRRITTGWLINLLTFFTQCTKLKHKLTGYLTNVANPVPLVLDLRVVHDRVGSSADPVLNGYLRYPNNLDQSLNDTAADKLHKYRADYIVNLSEFYSYMLIGKLTVFFLFRCSSSTTNPVVNCTLNVQNRSLFC